MYRLTYLYVGSRLVRLLPNPLRAADFMREVVETVDGDTFRRNDVLFKVRSDTLQMDFSYLLRGR